MWDVLECSSFSLGHLLQSFDFLLYMISCIDDEGVSEL